MKTLNYPLWLRKRVHSEWNCRPVEEILARHNVATVCEHSRCPNLFECWKRNEFAFMILGDRCTRNCKFCAVSSSAPGKLDSDEPERIARVAGALGLDYVVVTSVARDDLADGGSRVFAETIEKIRETNPGVGVEVLIPDFRADKAAIASVLRAKPDIIGHNLETVKRLNSKVRPAADYEVSLRVLSAIKNSTNILTKSGLILGMGEKEEEVLEAIEDLRKVNCDILTIGQYLPPARDCFPLYRYVPLEEFARWEDIGYKLGFKFVSAGPWVRSSYNAAEIFRKIAKRKAVSS